MPSGKKNQNQPNERNPNSTQAKKVKTAKDYASQQEFAGINRRQTACSRSDNMNSN